MKKKFTNVFRCNPKAKKILLFMRLTLFLMVLGVLSAYSNSYAQLTKVSLNVQEVKVKDVLDEIENQSDFYFMYDNKQVDVERKVDIEVNDKPIVEILEKLFEGTETNFKLVNKQILLYQDEKSQKETKQQNGRVTGKIIDSSGTPIPGVSVIVKGTMSGTISDIDGQYTIDGVSENSILVFSFVGMKKSEIKVDSRSVIDVKMVDETIGVEEVVAIGYGSQTKTSLTTAVSEVKGDELVKKTTGDMRKALQGAIPGLAIIDQGGAPGQENIKIQIRGITSINSVNPLVLIDGVEQDINSVDANAIESVTVLKDAASTAIYGSRGANGVIVITTKKGAEGKISLTYNGFYGVSNPTTWPDPIDTRGYMELQNLTFLNSKQPIVFSDIDGYIEKMNKYPDIYPEAFPQWSKFFNWAPTAKHSIVATGGTNTVRSMFNISYEDQESIIPGNGAKQFQLRSNNELTFNDNIKGFVNVTLDRNDSYRPNNQDQWYYQLIFNTSEFQNKHYPDGSYGFSSKGENIWYMTDTRYMGKVQSINDNATATAGLEINFLKNFKYQFSYMVVAGKDAITETSPKFKLLDYWTENSSVALRDINDYGEKRYERFRTTLNSLLTYQKKFTKNEINALLGYSEDEYQGSGIMASGKNFYNNEIRNLSQGDPELRSISNSYGSWGLRSFFGRAAYAYDKKYFVEVNGRYDGSSRFPAGNKYTLFPSSSLAWRLSEETFWDSFKSTINNFKLRYSYGVNGNQNIGNYTYIPQLGISNGYAFYNSKKKTEELVSTVGMTDLASTDLSWETTYQHNMGIDFSLMDNKLSVIIDLFSKTTDGILLDVPIAGVVGLNPSKTNAGIINNKGWESSLMWKDQIKDFKYSIGVNLSFVQDKLVDFGGLPMQTMYGRYYRAVGTPLFALYGYKNDGFYTDKEDVLNSAALGSKAGLMPGDLKYKDLSGPNGVPDGIISADYDMTDLGYGTPRYFFGANLNVDWKGFDMNMVWQGAGGHKVPLYGKIVETGGWGGWTPNYANKDYWSGPEDTDARFPIPRRSPGNNIQSSDFWLVNGTYLRLKSLTIGYTLPSKWVNYLSISTVRIYANAVNPLTFSELYSKWELEPEGSIGNLRYDYFPQIKSYNAGIMITF